MYFDLLLSLASKAGKTNKIGRDQSLSVLRSNGLPVERRRKLYENDKFPSSFS
jgi:hypothetical protein